MLSPGVTSTSNVRVSNGMTTLPGLRRATAAANKAATSTQRILLVAPAPRWPVIGLLIEPETSRPMTTGPGSCGTLPQATSAARRSASRISCGTPSSAFR